MSNENLLQRADRLGVRTFGRSIQEITAECEDAERIVALHSLPPNIATIPLFPDEIADEIDARHDVEPIEALRLEQPVGDMQTMASDLVFLSMWIDAHNADRDTEAQAWGRVSKVGEEFGEVIQAMIALTGQNPRKPANGTVAEVSEELLDVAITALAAVEHLQGNGGQAMRLLRGKIRRVAARARQG